MLTTGVDRPFRAKMPLGGGPPGNTRDREGGGETGRERERERENERSRKDART